MSFSLAANSLVADFLKTPSDKPKIVVLIGPTASGKTALSIELCKNFNGEVISADSRQVYRYMDIGTDKIPCEKTPEGLFHKGVRHHMIDIVNPDERFTVAGFKARSEKLIEEITARGAVPFVVGGTGLYTRALTENFLIPDESSTIRERLHRELREAGAEALHKKLQAVDPEAAAQIHYNNHPYVVRALEIFELTGKRKSQQKGEPLYDVLKIGLRWPREIMCERINLRAHEQLYKNGLVEETQALLARGYSPTLSSMSSLGYKETLAYLNGELTLAQADELLQQNTRSYGKRQLTWFNKEPNLIWLEAMAA